MAAGPVVSKLMETYKGKIRLVIKNYPYKYRDYAHIAAEASLAAADQGKYWEMHDLLLKNSPKLPGKTVLVVDISGSMGARLSGKSTMSRMDAAIALSIILEGLCEDIAIYATAGNDWRRIHATGFVPRRSGMALKDAICSMNETLGMGGIFLTQVCRFIAEKESNIDRLIVITDEADCSASDKDKPSLADPIGKNNYLINVASYKNGVGYGKWNHVDGFSESVVQFIAAMENNQ